MNYIGKVMTFHDGDKEVAIDQIRIQGNTYLLTLSVTPDGKDIVLNENSERDEESFHVFKVVDSDVLEEVRDDYVEYEVLSRYDPDALELNAEWEEIYRA